MKICSTFQPIFIQNNQNKNNSIFNSIKLSQLASDTVSFGAMKKNEFKGIDRVCVEKFKAPIEKFNKNEDLQNWAGKKLNNLIEQDYSGRHIETEVHRNNLIEEWGDYVTKENDAYKNTAGLLIMSAITRDLKPDNDVLPPVLNKGALAEVMSKVEQEQDINILKEYKNTLKNRYFNNNKISSNLTGWIIIPSQKQDPENFKTNVEKLKTLSHHNWCTHSFNAEPYLSRGDFHVYLEDGKPKLGVRFIGNKIEEIQGEQNNAQIPIKYYDVAKLRIKKYKLSTRAKEEVNSVEKTKSRIDEIKKILQPAIEQNNANAIFDYFGYLPNKKIANPESKKEEGFIDKFINLFVSKDDNLSIINCEKNPNNVTLAFYKQPGEIAFSQVKGLSFEDLGIDENKLFQKVKRINGDADFKGSKLKTFTNLDVISGSATFNDSQIRSLGSLKRICGDTSFFASKVKDLGNLKSIGGNVSFNNSEILSLCKLKRIGGNATFQYTKFKDLGNLKSIGGGATFENSPITSLANLQYIEGDADFSCSKVIDLGELESIGKDANFEYSKIKDLKNLKNIGGAAYIGHSEIKSSDLNKIYFCSPNEYKKMKRQNLKKKC